VITFSGTQYRTEERGEGRSPFSRGKNVPQYFPKMRYTSDYCAPAPKVGTLSDDARLTPGVCLSRTSGLSREQRGLGRLKLAEVARVTRDSDTTFKVKRSKGQRSTCRGGAYCGGLPHSLL